MRVAVDKTRHHYASIRADLDSAPRERQVFEPPGGADFHQHTVANQQSAVLDNAKLVEFSPTPGCLRTAKSEKLARSPDEYGGRTLSEMKLPYLLVRAAQPNVCRKFQQIPEGVR